MSNIKFNKYEYALFYEIFYKQEYLILDNFIKESDIIFDIWWHIWFFSLYCIYIKLWKFYFENLEEFFQKINSNKSLNFKIHFFEPSIENYNKSLSMLSNFKNNIFLNNFAIYSKIWYEKLYVRQDKNMQNSFYNNNFLNNSKNFETVKTLTLKDYIENNSVYKIDLLKMDIEWVELDIFLDLDMEIIKKIKYLFVEYHLLDNSSYEKYNLLIDKLKKIYKNVEVIVSDYTNKVWYLLAY